MTRTNKALRPTIVLLALASLFACEVPETSVFGPRAVVDRYDILFNNAWGAGPEIEVVTISNEGESRLWISDVRVSGAPLFGLVGDATDHECEIAPGDSHEIHVVADPSGERSAFGELTIQHNDVREDGETRVRLALQEIAPRAYITPEELDFGTIAPGTAAELPVTMTNIGSAPLTIRSIEVLGGADQFTIPEEFDQPGADVRQLIPNEALTLAVTFEPAWPESSGAILMFKTDDPSTADQSLELLGNQSE